MKKEKVFVFAATFATLFATLFIFAAGTDLNNDGTTNRTDISLLATVYRTGNATFDRNNDGVVNLFDMVSVARNISVNSSNASNDTYGAYRIFASEWNTATGNGSAAVLDSGRARDWDDRPTGNFEVRSTSSDGRDYPTTNYIRNSLNKFGGGDGGALHIYLNSNHGVAFPAVGEAITMRSYYRWIAGDEDLSNHAYYWGDSYDGDDNVLGIDVARDWAATGKFNIRVSQNYALPIADGHSIWEAMPQTTGGDPYDFDQNTTYRWEAKYERVTTDTWKIAARIYHINGTLVMAEDKWKYFDGGGPWLKLIDTTFDDNVNASSHKLDRFQLGSEGDDINDPTPRDIHEWAGLVIYKGPNASVPWPVGVYDSVEATWSP